MENWKPVVGYEGLYEVSDLGNVRGVDRILSDGRSWKGTQLKPGKCRCGYKFVCLRKEGIVKNENIHRLVASAFIENPDCCRDVNHKDGNKENNKADNLEWITHSDNMKHAARTGLRKTKIDMKTFEYIKEEVSKGRSQQDVSEELGVSQVLISQALLGKLAYLKK